MYRTLSHFAGGFPLYPCLQGEMGGEGGEGTIHIVKVLDFVYFYWTVHVRTLSPVLKGLCHEMNIFLESYVNKLVLSVLVNFLFLS